MPRLELAWLGSPSVTLDSVPVKLETRKVTALLALLSVDQRPHSRERLAALLWPDFDANRAPANLRRVLSPLQSSVGREWIAADRETIAVKPSAELWVDEVDLLNAVSEAQDNHRTGDDILCNQCEARLTYAVGSYRGEFLSGLNLPDASQFDLWQLTTRGETENAAHWAFAHLVRAAGYADHLREAIAFAQRHLSLDVLNEEAHRVLMELYCRSGKFAAALRQFDARRWYRYHHLFADLLHHRLDRECPKEEIALLHARAGRAFLATEDFEAAMEQFLRGGIYEEALDLMKRQNQRVLAPAGTGSPICGISAHKTEKVTIS